VRGKSMYRSDDALIRACRRGDARAWEHLVDKYERLVFSIPLNYGLSREDAADISQLTFTILIQSLDTLRPDSRLGPWLATVARRHTWRLLERQRREGTIEKEDLAENINLPDEADIETRENWELLEWLNHGLSFVSKRCRDLLLSLYFDPEQPSYAEVAERLQMRVGSIGPTRARCLERLKQVLGER